MITFDMKKYHGIYTADFETSTPAWNVNAARVWLWDICDTQLTHKNGVYISAFFDECFKLKNPLIFFHNLAYDGIYILSYLLNDGYTVVEDVNGTDLIKCVETVISDKGQHYCYKIRNRNKYIVFADSLKFIHLSVRKIGELFDLPIKKGEIDYNRFRPEGYTPTPEEVEYIRNDTEIVMRAVLIKNEYGDYKITQTGCAREQFKKSIPASEYKVYFPEIELDTDTILRRSYQGGLVYLNPMWEGQDLIDCISFDVNSMYPAQMLHKPIPVGTPVLRFGKPKPTRETPLFIVHLSCGFEIKKGCIPMIPLRKVMRTAIPQYMTTTNGKIVDIVLTSVDFQLFVDTYDIYDVQYFETYYFQAIQGKEIAFEESKTMNKDSVILEDGRGSIFYNYMLRWRMEKEHCVGAKRTNAKLMQNALYGALATNPRRYSAVPYLNDTGRIAYNRVKSKDAKPFYLPAGSFITAYARETLLTRINKIGDNFIYCDTDSIYAFDKPEVRNAIPQHDTLYGFFKVEHLIKRARFLGAKRYIYEGCTPSDDTVRLNVTCCGADRAITSQMTFDNFKNGATFSGKKVMLTVAGGKHIAETTYCLNTKRSREL